MFALFDLDNTVHDKESGLRECAVAIHTKFLGKSNVELGEFTSLFVHENCVLQPKSEVFAKLSMRFEIAQDLTLSMLDFFSSSFHHYAKCFDNVIESLEFLQASGVKIACVSNGLDFFQRNKIQALGLNRFFDVIVTSGELGAKKPDPLIFHTALMQLGAQASESVFIGDSLMADMQPAKALGMKTIWLRNGANVAPEFVDISLGSYSEFKHAWLAVTEVDA